MGRFLAKLLGFFLLGSILAGIASAIAAAVTKQRAVAIDDPAADEVDLTTIYEGREFRSEAPAFRGGSITTWYGGARVDLRAATLDPAGAHLRVRTVFGGTQLLVPDRWRVALGGPAVFGGNVVSARPAPAEDAQTLTIDAFTVFGGLRVDGRDGEAGEGAASAGTTTAEATSALPVDAG